MDERKRTGFRKRNQSEIAEDFISGLKKLFEEHYISVPDEKYDVLEDQPSKIESLENKLNEEIQKNVDLTKANSEKTKTQIVSEMGEDLADTAKEKFNKLAEELNIQMRKISKQKYLLLKRVTLVQRKSLHLTLMM